MSSEWDLLVRVANYLNNDLYDDLQSLIVENKNEITPLIVDALTELPVTVEMIEKYPIMYKHLIELADTKGDELGLRGSIRFEGMKSLYNKIHS